MNAAECAALAGRFRAMREVAKAAGLNLKSRDVEVLLWIAAGRDTYRELMAASGMGLHAVQRSVFLLSGRPVNLGPGKTRTSPFRLVDTRPHPHLPYPERQIFLTQTTTPNGNH
jgi:hypothetical protein